VTCEKCGATLEIGSFPFCKGGHSRGFMRVNGDECDYIDHNLGPEPIRITSWSQRRAIMAAKGLVDTGRCPPPPDDAIPNPQAPSNWNAYRDVSPERMAWLAERLATGKATKEPEDPPLRVRTYIEDASPAQLEQLR
jgi:hypothetical protein